MAIVGDSTSAWIAEWYDIENYFICVFHIFLLSIGNANLVAIVEITTLEHNHYVGIIAARQHECIY